MYCNYFKQVICVCKLFCKTIIDSAESYVSSGSKFGCPYNLHSITWHSLHCAQQKAGFSQSALPELHSKGGFQASAKMQMRSVLFGILQNVEW